MFRLGTERPGSPFTFEADSRAGYAWLSFMRTLDILPLQTRRQRLRELIRLLGIGHVQSVQVLRARIHGHGRSEMVHVWHVCIALPDAPVSSES